MRLLFFWLFSAMFCLPMRAEELLPRVQKELRARKFYFGEVDGKASKETAVAIKRFQLAKGIDSTGHLDGETLRALGFSVSNDQNAAEERQKLEAGSDFVRQYLEAREGGQWDRIVPFFADQVDFYLDHSVTREALRKMLARDGGNAANRQNIMLNRIASPLSGSGQNVQVTVRVQTRVTRKSGALDTETEDLLFRLRKMSDGWKITVLKLLE